MLREANRLRPVEVERIDDAVALAGHIVFRVRVLNCVGNEDLAVEDNDVERRIAARQGRIDERAGWQRRRVE